MLILRQNNYSWKDIAKTVFRGAVKELGKEYQDKDDDNSDVFGVLVIDRFIDKSRYIGKICKFNIDPDDYSVEGIFGSGSIYWNLSEEFEPLENCPKSWKEFNVSGLCKDGETLDARIIQKNGKILTGKVMVEVR